MKKIRLRAPEGLQTTGIYNVDDKGVPYEYPVGHVLDVADEFDHLAVWPGRSELVDKDGAPVVSTALTADGVDAAAFAALQAELAETKTRLAEVEAAGAGAPAVAKADEKKA
jgi:hypothetical protein